MIDPGAFIVDFAFGAPARIWLFCLVPVLVGAYAFGARQRRIALTSLGNPLLVGRLVASVHHGNRLLSALAVVATFVAIVFGLMRPQYGGESQIVPASGLDLVLAVDYSKSMLARDVYPSRSERLEAELTHFLDEADARGDRMGLVVFAGQARGFPITRDARMLKLYLERADPRTENPGGTAIGKALDLSLSFLVDARRHADGSGIESDDPTNIPVAENEQAIILLTDGEDTGTRPLEVAERAAQLGVRIYTVGIGSKSGEPIQKFDANGEPDGFVTNEAGEIQMTRLDDDPLKKLADVTRGQYVSVDPSTFGLDEVRAMLQELARSDREDVIEVNREEGMMAAILPALLLLALSLAIPDRRRPAAPSGTVGRQS